MEICQSTFSLRKIVFFLLLFLVAACPPTTDAGPLQRLKKLIIADNTGNLPQEQGSTPLSTKSDSCKNQRFAIDSAVSGQLLKQVVALGDGLSEIQGVGFAMWGNVEPRAPVQGVPQYRGPQDLKTHQRAFLKDYGRTGRSLSVALEFFENKWALEFSDSIMVQSPRSGKQVPGFVRIKKEHEQDFKNFIKYYISLLPSLEYIQIDNEPENVWVSGEGYARALRLAYEAVHEYNDENSKDIKVMAAGFYLGPQIISIPESIKAHIHANYPDLDAKWLRRELKIPDHISDEKLRHAAQKLHVVMSVLQQKQPSFDILSIHLDGTRPYDKADLVINWYRAQMKENSYQKPIWIDDMHSGFYPELKPETSESERAFYNRLRKNDPLAIARIELEQPKWLVKKTAGYFAAGFSRVKIAQLVDMPDYFMPEWRYAGLFTIGLAPKPSYYTARMLINKLDCFETATRLDGYVYRFTFRQKNDVFVAWSESGPENLDLSQQLGSKKAKITFLVNHVDQQRNPITKEPLLTPSDTIPLTDEPVFIEALYP